MHFMSKKKYLSMYILSAYITLNMKLLLVISSSFVETTKIQDDISFCHVYEKCAFFFAYYIFICFHKLNYK